MQSIKTNFEFPRGDDPIKQGQRLAQDISSNFKVIKSSIDSIKQTISGSVVLVGGTATVYNQIVTESSIILLTSQKDGGTIGFIRISSRSSGVSFTIQSSSGTDTSTIGWMIVQ